MAVASSRAAGAPLAPGTAFRPGGRAIDLGCGTAKLEGCWGVDRAPVQGVDLVADLDHIPYPFRDDSFDYLRLRNVLEHVADVVKTMEEVHRIARPGALVEITTPHYTDNHSWGDPTHRWHFGTRSLDCFRPGTGNRQSHYSSARFEVQCTVRLSRLARLIGLEWLVNSQRPWLRWGRQVWERQLCFVLRGSEMTFLLRAVK